MHENVLAPGTTWAVNCPYSFIPTVVLSVDWETMQLSHNYRGIKWWNQDADHGRFKCNTEVGRQPYNQRQKAQCVTYKLVNLFYVTALVRIFLTCKLCAPTEYLGGTYWIPLSVIMPHRWKKVNPFSPSRDSQPRENPRADTGCCTNPSQAELCRRADHCRAIQMEEHITGGSYEAGRVQLFSKPEIFQIPEMESVVGERTWCVCMCIRIRMNKIVKACPLMRRSSAHLLGGANEEPEHNWWRELLVSLWSFWWPCQGQMEGSEAETQRQEVSREELLSQHWEVRGNVI